MKTLSFVLGETLVLKHLLEVEIEVPDNFISPFSCDPPERTLGH